MVDFGVNKTHETVPNLPNTMMPEVQGRAVEDSSAQKETAPTPELKDYAEATSAKGMKEVVDDFIKEMGPQLKKSDIEEPEKTFKAAGEELDKAIKEMNGLAKNLRNDVRFQISEELGELVVQVIDSETDEVIRTIPPEYLLNLKVKLRDQVGLLLDREL